MNKPTAKSSKLRAGRIYKIRLKTGDMVMVRSGKHKGRSGKVLAVYPKLNKVTVEGINVVKKHRKPTPQHPQGGIIEITKPIWVSKLGLLDSVAKKPSRIGYKLIKDGAKVRVLKTSGKELK
ncbi:MAG: 50S ribosomal protein L24 [Candidatus Saccharimonadales bacterium]